LETSKVFNGLILEYLKSNGFDGLSDALLVLFPYLEACERTTASQLSKKVGYTRQAMHKNIKKLEEFEYIILLQENKKEKSIQLTSKGEKLVIAANRYIAQIENELAAHIGEKELEIFKESQMKIYHYLESIADR